MELKFRILKRTFWDGTVWYYPQVKGGLLGLLGIWRYFSFAYSLWGKLLPFKTTSDRSRAVHEYTEEQAVYCIKVFIENFKKPVRKQDQIEYIDVYV